MRLGGHPVSRDELEHMLQTAKASRATAVHPHDKEQFDREIREIEEMLRRFG